MEPPESILTRKTNDVIQEIMKRTLGEDPISMAEQIRVLQEQIKQNDMCHKFEQIHEDVFKIRDNVVRISDYLQQQVSQVDVQNECMKQKIEITINDIQQLQSNIKKMTDRMQLQQDKVELLHNKIRFILSFSLSSALLAGVILVVTIMRGI
jgi:hypothetical protein